MKKISLIFAFVLLVVAIFAINVFAAERTVTWDDVDANASNGQLSYGSLNALFDGNNASGGWCPSNGCAASSGVKATIVFKEELLVTSFDYYGWFNGTRHLVYCYDASGKEVAKSDLGYIGWLDGGAISIDVGDGVYIKKIVIEFNNSQKNDRYNQFVEFDITANCVNHDWIPATTEAPATCRICGETSGDPLSPDAPVVTGKNIEDQAIIKATDGNVYITNFEYLIDNDPSTGVSAGNVKPWINFHFHFEKPRAITKVKIVVNSTGTMYNVDSADGTYVHESMSNLATVYFRLYTASGKALDAGGVSTSNAVEVTKDGKTYMEMTFDLNGVVYYDIVKVEIAPYHDKNTKLGIWEVEIFDFQCQKETDHKWLDATCKVPETCDYCGATQGEISTEHTGTWSEATCTTLSTCSDCGATTGELSTNHTLLPANCGQPARCQYCDYTEGEVTGEPHQWKNASYTAPKTCKVCGATEGDKWVDGEYKNFVRGDEGDLITYDDIIGEVTLTENSMNGDHGNDIPAGTKPLLPEEVLDGSVAAYSYWGGPTGSSIKITLKNEWEITEAKILLFANWASLKVSYYSADNKLLGEKNIGGLQCNYEYFKGIVEENPIYQDYTVEMSFGDNDKAVKYIVITNTGDKWSWVPGVVECYFKGRERIPTNCDEHVFSEPETIKEPDCVNVGYTRRTCTVCGVPEGKEPIPALGHTFTEYETLREATCTVAPKIKFTCTRCNEEITYDPSVDDVMNSIDFSYVKTEGWGGYNPVTHAMFDGDMNSRVMVGANWYVQSSAKLDASFYISSITVWVGNEGYADHNSNSAWLILYYKAPGSDTWEIAGKRATPATYNGTKYEYILELDTPVRASEIMVYVGAEDGSSSRGDGLSSHNGVVYEANILGATYYTVANGHTWVKGETVAPKCYDFGYTTYTCSDCGATKNDDIVRETNHIWADATCTAPKTCTACSETSGEALGHDMTVEATCTTALKCSRCDYTEGDALGHDLVAGETFEPDCESNGYTVYECSRCDYSENKDETAALGHDWNDADCVTAKTCSVCGATEGKALGHILDGEMIYSAPTCKDAGYDAEKCTVCGETVVTFEYPADPSMHEKIWETEARNEADTGYTYTCYVCGGIVEEITKGTANEPIIVEPGVVTNTVYAKGSMGVIYQIAVSEYGKLVITFETENGAVIFADSTMAFMRGMFFQTYGKEFVTVVDPNNLWTGYYYFAVPATAEVASFNVAFVAQERPVLSLGENKIDATQQGTKVTISTPGDYILKAPNGANVSYCPDEYSTEYIDLPFEFKVEEGQTVTFSIGTSSFFVNYEVVTLVLEENKPAHTHTEVVIPAVRPTPSTEGFTAGIACSDCGETIKAPVAINVTEMADTRDPAFRIAAANLSLQENISVNYWAVVTTGYSNPYMVFVFNNEEYIVEEYNVDPSNGRLGFNFDQTFPNLMGDNIEAYVYAETAEGEYSRNKILEYSVMTYCVNQLKKNDATLTNMISDVLVYGAKTQLYMGHNTSNLVTDRVAAMGYTLKPTAYASIDASKNVQTLTGDRTQGADWKSATVVFGSSTEVKLFFTADSIEGLTVNVNLVGKDKVFTEEDFLYDESVKRYYVLIDYVKSYEYNETITSTFHKDGAQFGSVLTYSINSYLYRNAENTSHTAAARNLLQALYVYGETIANYPW